MRSNLRKGKAQIPSGLDFKLKITTFVSMRKHIIYVTFLSLFIFIFEGCETEKSFIPSYLKIDSVLVDAKSISGNNVHQIAAIQLYQNKTFLGTYPIPSKIPINAEGKNVFSFAPYVRMNGNSSQLAPYLSLQFQDTALNVARSSVTEFVPIFKYRQTAKILWQEDFEDVSSTLVPVAVAKGDTTFMDLRDFDLDGRFIGKSKVFVAKFQNIDTFKSMDLASFTTFKSIPVDGTDVYLDLDIKTDLPLQISLRRTSPTKGTEFVNYLLINPTKGKWKRFYIDFVYETQGQPTGTTFEIFFSTDKGKDFTGSHEILIDNLRLSHLNK